MPTFTPPVLAEVTPLSVSMLDNPLGCRLMRFYPPRLRGATVYKMSDGSYRIAREIPGLTGGPPVLDAWPALRADSTIDGTPNQVNNVISMSWLYGAVVSEEFQTPAVEIVYYGGHIYPVSVTEGADLIAAGLGAYVH